jgi:hypothetical protein
LALLALLEDFELASLFLLALETPGTAEDDFPDLPEAEDTSDDSPLLLGALVGEEDTSDGSPLLLGALVGEEDTSDDLPTLGAADSACGVVTGCA